MKIENIVKAHLKKQMACRNRFVFAASTITYFSLKAAYRLFKLPRDLYEKWICKFLAKYFFFLYWPAYKILKRYNIRFVLNSCAGVGHVLPEFESFFHRRLYGELSPSERYVVILKGLEIYRDFLSFYGKLFFYARANTFLYYLLAPIWMRWEDVRADVGVSRMKLYFPTDPKTPLAKNRPYVYQLSTLDGIIQQWHYMVRRARDDYYYPLEDLPAAPQALLTALGLNDRPYCIVHIKTAVMNCTAIATDPKNYLAALRWLMAQGYALLFAGREPMPKEFLDLGMINYSQSRYASFKNDLLLFKSCRAAVLAGSGISYLADSLNKPYLYINSWHFGLMALHPLCICVPTLVSTKEGRKLTFLEQTELYLEDQSENEIFPKDLYDARHASSVEILEAVKELLSLERTTPLSPLQEKFHESLTIPLAMKFQKIRRQEELKGILFSRMSNHFLKQHQDRFEPLALESLLATDSDQVMS